VSEIFIFGAGGHARVIAEIFKSLGISVLGFIDDNPTCRMLDGLSVHDSRDPVWLNLTSFRFIVGIGDNRIRASIFNHLVSRGGTPISVLHPSAVISRSAVIGSGTVVMPGVIINSGAVIGSNSILNTGCSVDHDCSLGDHVHICPGGRLAGNVSIGDYTMLGLGCCVIPGREIGPSSVIGAGSVVITDLPASCCAFGNPARVKRYC
jgi:sugar O-acyltransferase (sialic acid O-acetyltransferase NeuD family)